jgi:hypothetical protein
MLNSWLRGVGTVLWIIIVAGIIIVALLALSVFFALLKAVIGIIVFIVVAWFLYSWLRKKI